jgi:hypothetical protein
VGSAVLGHRAGTARSRHAAGLGAGRRGRAGLLRRLPGTEVVHVEEAGHSLQGDTPLELAEIIDRFVYRRFVNDRFVWGSSVTSKQTAPSLSD